MTTAAFSIVAQPYANAPNTRQCNGSPFSVYNGVFATFFRYLRAPKINKNNNDQADILFCSSPYHIRNIVPNKGANHIDLCRRWHTRLWCRQCFGYDHTAQQPLRCGCRPCNRQRIHSRQCEPPYTQGKCYHWHYYHHSRNRHARL